MSGFIAQQPNGLYCRFSTIVDTVTHYNMTREDYLNNATGNVKDRQDAESILTNYLQPFSEVKERFVPNNMTKKEFVQLVKVMSEPVNKPITSREAIEVIKSNYPPERYSRLREALDLAMKVLEEDAEKEEFQSK